eukprot:1176184-Prorocentrum_minimum.AAC.2
MTPSPLRNSTILPPAASGRATDRRPPGWQPITATTPHCSHPVDDPALGLETDIEFIEFSPLLLSHSRARRRHYTLIHPL